MKRLLVIAGCVVALAVMAATQSQYFSGDLIVGGAVKDPAGAFWIKDAPLTNSLYGRSNGLWVAFSPGGGGGISHGPSDGVARGSRNGAWDIIDTSDLANFASWAESFVAQSSASGGRSVLGLGNSATRDVGTGSGDVAQGDHSHAWGDITGKPSVSTNGHTHSASDITSGVLAPARLGSGTATTSTYLRGDGSGGTEFATLPTTPGPTNGIPDAPDDGVAYARKGLAWVPLDIDDLAGVTAFGVSLAGAVDEVDALGLLALTGGGAATIDSPAKFGVRANSGGSTSIRHRLNLIGGSGITVSLSDDAGNDESDATITIGTHSHSIAEVTGLQTALDGKSATNHTHADLANFVFVTVAAVTDTNQDATYRSVLGTVKSGYSSTLSSGSLASGSVVRIEASGVFVGDDAHNADVELKIGSSLKLHFDVTEPLSTGPTEGTPWNLTAWLTVTTAGSSATVNVNGWMDYADNTGGSTGVYAPSPLSRSKAIVSGTLNTTTGNAVDLVYRGNDSNADSFSCTHFILQQF